MPIMAGLSALQTFEALAAIAARKTGQKAISCSLGANPC